MLQGLVKKHVVCICIPWNDIIYSTYEPRDAHMIFAISLLPVPDQYIDAVTVPCTGPSKRGCFGMWCAWAPKSRSKLLRPPSSIPRDDMASKHVFLFAPPATRFQVFNHMVQSNLLSNLSASGEAIPENTWLLMLISPRRGDLKYSTNTTILFSHELTVSLSYVFGTKMLRAAGEI